MITTMIMNVYKKNINDSVEKPLSKEELRNALNIMKNGKAP